MSDFQLVTDAREISSITAMRVMVSSALLYTFTLHYIFLIITNFFREDVKKQRIYDMGRRLSLYGIASLLSINFLQYGIYHAIMAWVLLLTVLVANSIGLMREIKETKKNVSILVYYMFIFIWLFGILFFYIFNAHSQ